MGRYERIAVELLELAFGDRWVRDDTRVFSFGLGAGTGEVDGTIDGWIAIEIGVGSSKQIRASVLDLSLHPYRGKLLILVDTPSHSTERSVLQSASILARLGCSGIVSKVPDSVRRDRTVIELQSLFDMHHELTPGNSPRVLAASR